MYIPIAFVFLFFWLLYIAYNVKNQHKKPSKFENTNSSSTVGQNAAMLGAVGTDYIDSNTQSSDNNHNNSSHNNDWTSPSSSHENYTSSSHNSDWSGSSDSSSSSSSDI